MAENQNQAFADMEDQQQSSNTNQGSQTNRGKNLTTEARAKGGRNSRRNSSNRS